MDVLIAARIAHEVNRAYCEATGDLSQPAWEDASVWQKQSAVKGIEHHWQDLATGRKPTPSSSHESWLREKERDGWKLGPEKDPTKKEHPCMVPYSELPATQRAKDYMFIAVAIETYRLLD